MRISLEMLKPFGASALSTGIIHLPVAKQFLHYDADVLEKLCQQHIIGL